jgi:hypothetical protein
VDIDLEKFFYVVNQIFQSIIFKELLNYSCTFNFVKPKRKQALPGGNLSAISFTDTLYRGRVKGLFPFYWIQESLDG